jgi:cell filamentation protein
VSGFQDPQAYPGTDNRVLINKFDERDYGRLRQLEYAATLRRLAELQLRPINGRFDLDHLQAIHRHVFQDVYAWAGELRQINLAKNGSFFTDGRQLEREGARVFGELAAERHLRGLDKAAFVERLAVHYGAINTLHPFREGNGRATQTFLQQLARQAGYEIDYTKIDKARWNAAAAATHDGRFEPMRAVLDAAVSPARALAFERLPADQAVRQHPELRSVFALLGRAAQAAAARFLRREDQDRFVGETRERVRQGLHAGQTPREGPQEPRQGVKAPEGTDYSR